MGSFFCEVNIIKIFISGSRELNQLPNEVLLKLQQFSDKNYDILIGDCYGIDSSIQKFYYDMKYANILVYASNGKARNNIGRWNIKNIAVKQNVYGFDFYKQKDIAMAKDADYGFMIWDGKSKGTLNNMVNLLSQGKFVLVYLSVSKHFFYIKSLNGLAQFILKHSQSAYETYTNLTEDLLSPSRA